MTISSQIRKAGPYIGNGSASAFPFAFKVFTAADLYVVKTNTTLGADSVLTLGADYTVSLNADQNANPGGTITLTAGALASGYNVTITSSLQYLQPTDLTNQGGFYPSVITNALDRLTIFCQQLYDAVSRSLKVSVSTPNGVSTTLPPPAANKLIGWNPTADNLQNMDPTALATIVAFGTANADKYSGDGSTTQFALSANPGALNNLDVSIGGVSQRPGIDYTWSSGTTITFTSAPPAGTNNVLVRYMQALPQGAADWYAITGNPILDVKKYGAKGDGTSDDTAAIQAALATGKNVLIPTGCNCKVTASLSLSSNQTVTIEDGASVFGNFADYIFKTQGTTSAALSSVTGAISTLATNFTMADASGLSAGDMILVYDVVASRGDINVVDYESGNTVYPFFPMAMSFATPANVRVYKLNSVQRARITGGGTVFNTNAGGGAVSWLYTLDCEVTGIRFNNNAYIACTFQNSIGGVMEGNVVTNNGFSGLGLRQAKGCRIRGNKLFNNKGDEPITLYLSNTHNVIEGNVVVQECQNGSGIGGNAILFDTDNYFNVVKGNTLEGCPTYLIYLHNNASFNTVIGNVCNRALAGSIKLDANSNYNVIDGNVCSNVLLAVDSFEGGPTYAIRVKSDCSYNYVGTNNFFGLAAGSVLDAQATPRAGYATKFGLGTTSPYTTLDARGGSFGATTTDFVPGSVGSALVASMGASSGNTFAQINVGTGGDMTVGHLSLMRYGGSVAVGRTAPQSGGKFEVDGNIVANIPGSAPTLGVNNDMSFQLVSNTSLKVLVRGNDGVTRSATLTLA